MKKKNKKCVLLLPYFGKFNNYFQLFLNSCKKNPTYNWIIFTDCTDKYDYPVNVRVVPMTLYELKKIAEKKLGFSVRMETPYKLCDYKPAYGFLFEEYIEEYEYWGHCDCDLIFGNLEKMLTPLLSQNYDKLFAAGHLTIYKNNYENNRKFMSSCDDEYYYKNAFTTDNICVFDEDYSKNGQKKNIHTIFLKTNSNMYEKDISFNVTSKFARIRHSYYAPRERKFLWEEFRKSRFYWDSGNIIEVYYDKKNLSIKRNEYIYIHLQNRKMRIKNNILKANNIIEILPDRFKARKKIPTTLKEMKLLTIKLPYLYWFDIYLKKIKLKLGR